MIAELKPFYDEANQNMHEAVDYLKRQLSTVRAGKATPSLLDGIKVDYYGAQTPLNQLANVSAPDPKMLVVEPFDKSAIKEIEKAIMASGLGLNPNNDGNIIRIPLPELTEERRKELVKYTREIAEQARISIRNARQEAKNTIKKKVKSESLPEDEVYNAEEALQKLTDHYNKEIEELLESKEKDILTV